MRSALGALSTIVFFTVTTEYMYLCTFADHEHLLLHMHLMFVEKLAFMKHERLLLHMHLTFVEKLA